MIITDRMSSTRKIMKGAASNILRLMLSVVVAMVLPPLLVHHLSEPEYSAWVLILQLSTYIGLLDLGLQTIIGKMIAENHAVGDIEANHRLLSTSFSLLIGIAVLGMLFVGVMVWQVPQLFHQMPQRLFPDVRLGLLLVGFSAAFALPFNPFVSVFTGLQSYRLPTVIALLSRLLSATLLIALVLMHVGIVKLTLTMALVNVSTAMAQFWGWKLYARRQVAFTFFQLHADTVSELLRAGTAIAIWSVGELFVSGLDLVLVGHFDYGNTGFYAIATSATNFMLMIISSLFSPLLPAIAAKRAISTPQAIGQATMQASRYCTLTLCALSLPLLLLAFPLLSLWVGHTYAVNTVVFLQILVISNCLRQLCYPYSLAVIATGKQNFATLASVAEAVVNLAMSFWLGSKIGARGIAFGTLAGAAVSLVLHLTSSMSQTRSAIDLPTSRFVIQSLLRPLSCVIPSFLILPFWNRRSMTPAPLPLLAAWLVSTILIMYIVGLTKEDRVMVRKKLKGKLPSRVVRTN